MIPRSMALHLSVLLMGIWPLRVAFSQQVESPYKNFPYWYRGDTHIHTNMSDGQYPLEDVVKRYQAAGYHFIVVTDHNDRGLPGGHGSPTWIKYQQFARGGPFLAIRGCESGDFYENHLIAANTGVQLCPEECSSIKGREVAEFFVTTPGSSRHLPDCDERENQKRINQGLAVGATVILAHPSERWSGYGVTVERGWTTDKMMTLRGYHAIEINGSLPEWQSLLDRGRWVFGVAATDFHGGRPGREFIMVNSQANSPVAADLMQNIQNGNLYAVSCKSCPGESWPHFDEIQAAGAELVIRGHNATTARLIPTCGGAVRTEALSGDPFSIRLNAMAALPATYKYQHRHCFVRVELKDKQQNVSYSQPFRVFNTPCVDTAAVSEEGGSPPALCPGGKVAEGLTCTGPFCDNLSLHCSSPPKSLTMATESWSAWFSEEAPNNSVTSSGIVTGIRCSGANCDSVSLQITTSPSLVQDAQTCKWSAWVSEEQGQQLCAPGYFVSGAKCRGDYCDDISLWCCGFNNSAQCSPPDCSDGNPCTVDSCAMGACQHQYTAGCGCQTDAACDDGNHCTQDTCQLGRCAHMTFCTPCITAKDCGPAPQCKRYRCASETCQLIDIPRQGACDDCDPCTKDRLERPNNCRHDRIPGCKSIDPSVID